MREGASEPEHFEIADTPTKRRTEGGKNDGQVSPIWLLITAFLLFALLALSAEG